MTPATLAQTDLFADLDQAYAFPVRRQHAKPAAPERMPQRSRVIDYETAAQLLDASDDYRVLRRLRPRDVDTSYRPGPVSPSPSWSTSRRLASTIATTK